MRENPTQILRGQMYTADLDPVIGSEQGGVRPVLVVQNDVGNRYSPTVIVVPITTQIKKMEQPTHIGIPPYFDLPEQSMAMLEQIRTVDRSRLREYIGNLDDDIMDCIDEALGVSIGLKAKMRRSKPRREKETPEEMLLCLCPTCASQFYNSPVHVIRRVAPLPRPTESCTYCEVRKGYDYRITHRRKRLGDDLV